MSKYDFLIVGAGLFGATFSRLATDSGYNCLIVDKRDVIGGNLYCENIKGINVHKYGAHIFHTSNQEIWDFLNKYVKFNRYTNCPVAVAANGKMYNLPFNMNTFYSLWGCKTPQEAIDCIEFQRKEVEEKFLREGIKQPRNLEEQALSLVGKDIYELLIKGYTEKQWGRTCLELPPSIIRRLPVRMTFDNNYFNDSFQGIPIGGYNVLINKLIDGATVKLGIDYLKERENLNGLAEHIIFTGPIDAYFDYCFGYLQWRTVRFSTKVVDNPNVQGNAVVNYTDIRVPYTRIIEHKHFETFGNDVYKNPVSVVSEEYPEEWKPGMEPYYPVNETKNAALYERYNKLASELKNVSFGGRLGTYSYLDMDKVVAGAFELWNNTIKNRV